MSRRIRQRILDRLTREEGAVRKDPGGKINVALVFPNRYRLGMSNLGFQGIYSLLNGRDDVLCERAFLPEPEDLAEHRKRHFPLVSYESQRPLSQFHVVAFSVSYENDYPNVPALLALGGIPPWARDRTGHAPLVILGGVCPSYNPEPLAPFADVVFIGEAETIIDPFFAVLATAKDRDSLRSGTLGLQGIYWPALYAEEYDEQGRYGGRKTMAPAPETIVKGLTSDLDSLSRSTTVFTRETEFSDMCLTEVSRGCPWGCNFCVAGAVYLPVRHRGIASVRRRLEEVAGTRRLGIVAPSPSDYPSVEDLLAVPEASFSLSSLRARKKTAKILPLLVEKGQKSISIAPEAGTERLREVIRKRITEEEIIETAAMASEAGIQTVRLYFMVGLPTETEDDVQGIADLAARVRQEMRRGRLVLSVGCFVPKPFTAFQWEAFQPVSVLNRRMAFLKKAVRHLRGVSLSGEAPSAAMREAFLSRGDRRAANVVHALGGGTPWSKALRESGADLRQQLRRREYGEPLPWDFIDLGIEKDVLRRRAEKAWKHSDTGGS